MTATHSNAAYAGALDAMMMSAARGSVLGISLTLYHTLDEVEAEWRALEQSAPITVFQKFDYIAEWMRQVGRSDGVRPAIIAGRGRDGETVFLLPFGIKRRFGTRVLVWLGAASANYQGGLFTENVLKQLNPVSFRLLWRELEHTLPPFDGIFLENQPVSFHGVHNPLAALGMVESSDDYYLCPLRPDFDALLNERRSARARRIMRKRDRGLEALGALTFALETDPDVIAADVETILREKNQQLARFGRGQAYSEPVCALIKALTRPVNGKPGLFELFTLRLDGELIAASITACHGKIMCGLVLYMKRGDYDKYSPGDCLMRKSFEFACKNGLDFFDLSIGRAPYKLNWCDEESALFHTITWRTLRGVPLIGALYIRRRLKRWIKSSDRLTAMINRCAGFAHRMLVRARPRG